MGAPAGRAIWSGQLDLADPSLPEAPRAADGRRYDAARVLIRLDGDVLGFVEIDTREGEIPLEPVLERARHEFAERIAAARSAARAAAGTGREAPAPGAGPTPRVSVILCTRNRPEGARRCLEALRGLRHPELEILVVDNAPSDDRTEAMVREVRAGDDRVRYVREPRPGLSCARNRGLAEASGEIVAFTDDDVRADPLWLDGVLRGFARDRTVACVTGLVASASLEHPAEQYFDGRVFWSSHCEHALYRLASTPGNSRLHPYAAGSFGTGANFAFRRATLRELGGFDECLGAGSPTQGGEDLDIFVRTLRAGHALSYEPSALVWHDHRVNAVSLRAQMRDYGMGLAAYLTKYLISPRTGPEVRRRMVFGAVHAVSLARRSRGASQRSQMEAGLLRAEILGLLRGPGAYLRARRHRGAEHNARVAPR